MIKKGKPRTFDLGTCPGMDEANHPEGYYVRAGKGLQPGAYIQDCEIYEENKDRAQVIDYIDNAGVAIPVMQLIGDGPDANGRVRTGGVYVLRPLEHPCTWASGQGIRQRVVFSPQSPVQQDWYFNVELRGELSFDAKNEGSSCVLVAIKNEVVKVAWYRDAVDGDGGGQRIVKEYPVKIKQGRWYELIIDLEAVPEELNTWGMWMMLTDLKKHNRYTSLLPESTELPNRIKAVTMVGMGDEQQGLDSGGTFLISVDTDERLEHSPTAG